MKILRVWFEDSEDAFVSVYWERGTKSGRKVSELLCMTNSVSKAGNIVFAMRAMMERDPKPPRPKIPGFRSMWSASQHKWQLVPSKTKKMTKATKKLLKKAKGSARRGRLVSSSSASLRDTDWHDKDARFRGPRGDTW